jgi:NAD(P)-dependent dehydrogenase (short-subunit alcohol dehydrogenase family)
MKNAALEARLLASIAQRGIEEPLEGETIRRRSGGSSHRPLWDGWVKPMTSADLVALLCSDDARWLTGQRLEATGGFNL